MRDTLSKIRPMHIALLIASVLYIIAGAARSDAPGQRPTGAATLPAQP